MSISITDDQDQRVPLLKGFADMRGDMVERADRSVKDGAKPTVDRHNGLYALKLAQMRHRLREGRPEAVEEALRAAGMLTTEASVPPATASEQPGMPDVRWFVAQSKPGAETRALQTLAEARVRACSPTIGRWAQLHRRDVVRVSYVFPRYIFVGLVPDRRGDIDFRTPRLCDGMASFVEGAGNRIEVRDTAVGNVMAASEMGWLDLIMERARRKVGRKAPKDDAFLRVMADVMALDAPARMRLFLEHFGARKGMGQAVAG